MSLSQRPYHIWCLRTGTPGVLGVQSSPYGGAPEEGLGLHLVATLEDAHRLILSACSLVTAPGPERAYVFESKAHNDILAATLLSQRLQELHVRLGLPDPESDIPERSKRFEGLDFQEVEIDWGLCPISVKRFERLDLPPGPLVSKRIRGLDLDG